MKGKDLQKRFALAMEHVRKGNQILERQERIVLRLESKGFDVTLAKHLWKNFIELQALHIADCDRIRTALAADNPHRERGTAPFIGQRVN